MFHNQDIYLQNYVPQISLCHLLTLELINDKEKFVAHNFEGKYLDCGTMKGYINSSNVIGKLWNYAWLVQVM